MRILLLELPVHIPTVMPYSITMMKSVLSSCLNEEISILDLNAEFHYNEYKEYYLRKEKEDYFVVLDEFVNQARHDYSKISKSAIHGELPNGHQEMMKLILKKKPDIVAMSLAYNSQIFFASGIIDELNKKGIKVVVGGPADKTKIKDRSMELNDYDSLIKFLIENGAKEKKEMQETYLDFSDYDKKKYFTKDFVYPLRTAYSCPYKLCAFCTHHQNSKYELIDLDFIKRTIQKNNIKKVFFIDDGFSKKRLFEIIEMITPLKITFWMQIRPEKWVLSLLPDLYNAGLRCVAWGIESGSQRVLDFMDKGTNIKDVKEVLSVSRNVGIKNIAYIMFGFPTESKEEFIQTLDFLEENINNIDLVAPSIFGLQEGSRAMIHQDRFGVQNVSYEKRTLLGERIYFEASSGLSQDELKKLKKKNMYKINKIDKYPKIINSCREQILNL